jgi:putative spermidine/putrescine transport system permease protein
MLPACLVLSVGLLVPLAYLIAFSFNPSRIGSTTLSATFSLAQYTKLFSDGYYLYVLFRSLSVAVATTAICVVTGYILAFALWRAPKRLRAIGTVIVLAPLLVSIVARTYGWMVILGDRGVINSLLLSMGIIDQPLQMMYTQGAVIVGLVHVFMPFMVLSILASLERINPALDEAALTLGATPLQSARLIFLPLSLPGLSAGITIVFSLSMAAYITPALMGGRGADVLPTLVYQQFVVVYNWHFGSALVVMLLATSLIVVTLLIQALGRRTRAWTVGA